MAHDVGKQVMLGYALVAVSAVAWSTAGIFTKGVEADVWTVLLWRGLLAAGVMSAWLAWRQGRAGLAGWKHLGWPGWSAATVSSAATICFIAAFKNTAVANVAIIYATAPFAAAAIAWVWMRETPGLATLAAAGLCLAGVTVMVGGWAGTPDLTGDLLALGMTALMALMMVIMRRHADRPMTLAAEGQREGVQGPAFGRRDICDDERVERWQCLHARSSLLPGSGYNQRGYRVLSGAPRL